MRLEEQPRLVSGPGFFASVLDWARRVVQAINTNVDALRGFTVTRSGANGTVATIAPINGGNGDAVLVLDKVGPAQSAAINGTKSGVIRWQVLLGNSSAEAGANAGSDASFVRFNDAGGGAEIVMSFLRNSGQVNITRNLIVGQQVHAGGAHGFYSDGSAPDGANYFAHALLGNPNWEGCNVQYYHVPGTWAGMRMILGTTSPAVFEFRNNGTGYSVGGWVATSDGRVKINRQPLGDVLSWIDDVIPCEYDRTDVANLDGSPVHRAGFIADHFEPHAPTLVMRDRATDDNPDPIRSLDYDGASAYLWRAVQQIKAELAEVRAELQSLKGN